MLVRPGNNPTEEFASLPGIMQGMNIICMDIFRRTVNNDPALYDERGDTLEWDLNDFKIRPWKYGDEVAMVKHANNRKVWRNLRDRFPHPYTTVDARNWIEMASTEPMNRTNWAVEVDGEAAGGIGLTVGEDVHRLSAEIGYWLGEKYWNRGFVTRAAGVITNYGLNSLGLRRIFTGIFEWNPASMRVLEKNGFQREGIERKSIIKDGQVIDAVIYSKVKGSNIVNGENLDN